MCKRKTNRFSREHHTLIEFINALSALVILKMMDLKNMTNVLFIIKGPPEFSHGKEESRLRLAEECSSPCLVLLHTVPRGHDPDVDRTGCTPFFTSRENWDRVTPVTLLVYFTPSPHCATSNRLLWISWWWWWWWRRRSSQIPRTSDHAPSGCYASDLPRTDTRWAINPSKFFCPRN